MRKLTFILSLALLPFTFAAYAQTQYVTDNVEIMMRSGPSNKNKIIKILQSGQPLEIIVEDAGNGHSQIRTDKGDVGFVLTRYISDTPSARDRVTALQARLDQLRAKPGELQALLATAQEDNQSLIAMNSQLTAKLTKTTSELEQIKRVSADAVNLSGKNERLEDEVRQLLLQMDDVRIQNETLKDQNAQRWFLLGSGAVLFGLFLGWLLSISRRPRRQSWGS